MVLLNQGECFGQQFHARPKLVLLAAVFKSQVALIVRIEVLTGDAHRIRIGSAGIAGKQKKVTYKDVRGAPCGYLHVTDFLEVLTAQRPRCTLCLLR